MARLTRLSKEFRCPECSSTSIQTRLRTKERVCRRCGYVGKMKEFEIKPDKPKK